jgi:hypothetical protein
MTGTNREEGYQMRLRYCVSAILSLTLITTASAATTILNVDFNSDSLQAGVFSPTQTGFDGVNVVNGLGINSVSASFPTNPAFTSGTTTVTISDLSDLIRSRDRATSPPNSGAFTYADLYSDFALADKNGMVTTITGLNPNTTYNIRFFAYDDLIATADIPNTEQFTNTTAGLQPSPSVTTITYGSLGAVTSNFEYSATLNATSNSSGTISFNDIVITQGNQTVAILNGLSIAAAPEPGTLTLLASSCLFLLFRKNHRQLNHPQ